ncbi:unnamed protein product [Gongylonema pulchrum]|uniref:CULT domain-containing protein n=1 Tax=Gongylonema pulchrum TaxID=637853 RepID=A0A183EHA4_9BILA|nr:unnamed protein product [Gongylonema pulchrum]
MPFLCKYLIPDTELEAGSTASSDLLKLSSKCRTIGTPTVYTCGVCQIVDDGETSFAKAGYGVYWPHAAELGTGRRYSFYPITLVRCQLQAIIEALQQPASPWSQKKLLVASVIWLLLIISWPACLTGVAVEV